MSEEKKGGKFFNGFFWGAFLGGGIAYILSHKKGRELAKELITDGIELMEQQMHSHGGKIKEEINPMLEEDLVVSKNADDAQKKENGKKKLFKKSS